MKRFDYCDRGNIRYYKNEDNLTLATMDLDTGSYSCSYHLFDRMKISEKLFLLGEVKTDSIEIMIGGGYANV